MLGKIFPEPQLCVSNHENQLHYMLILCLYKSFMTTFVEWLKENFLLYLHCDVLLWNVYHSATAFLHSFLYIHVLFSEGP